MRYNMKIFIHGKPQPGFLVANHTSYLDPIVIQAIKTGGIQQSYFPEVSEIKDIKPIYPKRKIIK